MSRPQPAAEQPRVWSEQAWRALVPRIVSMIAGGGETSLYFTTEWEGNVRWGRNRVNTSGDVRNNTLTVARDIRGARGDVTVNQLDDVALRHAVAYAEGLAQRYGVEWIQLREHAPFSASDYLRPSLWFQSTYDLDGTMRATAAQRAIAPAERAGMVTAGYLEAALTGVAVEKAHQRMALYYPVTEVQYSLTVRDPSGTGSGWAGVNWNDWTRVDVDALAAVALEKCLRSRNAVRLEPGRYTVILEPQAAYGLVRWIVDPQTLSWSATLAQPGGSLYGDPNVAVQTKLGQRLIDPRLTIRTDPMDPDLGAVPFTREGEPIRSATWFDQGVLSHLAYDRSFAVQHGVGNLGLPANGTFRLEGAGAATTVDDMITSTKRGVVVTRFGNVHIVPTKDPANLLISGYTRDGLWLVENGKISKPIMNFRFLESPLFALNRVEAIGATTRVFAPGSAAMVPALKIKDFSFVALSDAV